MGWIQSLKFRPELNKTSCCWAGLLYADCFDLKFRAVSSDGRKSSWKGKNYSNITSKNMIRKKSLRTGLRVPNETGSFFSVQFWCKTDSQCYSQNPTLQYVHMEQAGFDCSGLCNTQPSCEFSLFSLMEGRVQCQAARLLPLINLIRLRGRTPQLTSGLHALTAIGFSLTAAEPRHSATQEADPAHSVTLVCSQSWCMHCVVLA